MDDSLELIVNLCSDITCNSKEVKEGVLFIAAPGKKFDGRDYIAEAICNGATAIIYERKDFFVREIYVTENFRGIALATEMVQFFKDQASTENGKMFVDLQFGNKRAEKFWRSAGFLPFQQRYILDE